MQLSPMIGLDRIVFSRKAVLAVVIGMLVPKFAPNGALLPSSVTLSILSPTKLLDMMPPPAVAAVLPLIVTLVYFVIPDIKPDP